MRNHLIAFLVLVAISLTTLFSVPSEGQEVPRDGQCKEVVTVIHHDDGRLEIKTHWECSWSLKKSAKK